MGVAFAPRLWAALAAFLLVAGYTAVVYRAGGAAPRAELAALTASVKAASDIIAKRDADREEQHKQLLKRKDDERIKATADARDAWSAYNRLRKSQGSASGNAKPVPVTTDRCDDPASNQAISAAISRYRDDVRAAHEGSRDAVAAILEQAQLQVDALVRLQEWAVQEQQINR